jgi:predicted DNA-binding transcriptional regulator AlpA
MSEWLILIFVLYVIYLIMKKPKTSTEKPVAKAEPAAPKPVVSKAKEAAPKKPSPAAKVVKSPEPKVPAAKPASAVPELSVSERVGFTAGNIWHYLNDNGATSVAKLIRELPEEEKIIQRSIGWLAQEGKITLNTIDRAETIALKG